MSAGEEDEPTTYGGSTTGLRAAVLAKRGGSARWHLGAPAPQNSATALEPAPLASLLSEADRYAFNQLMARLSALEEAAWVYERFEPVPGALERTRAEWAELASAIACGRPTAKIVRDQMLREETHARASLANAFALASRSRAAWADIDPDLRAHIVALIGAWNPAEASQIEVRAEHVYEHERCESPKNRAGAGTQGDVKIGAACAAKIFGVSPRQVLTDRKHADAAGRGALDALADVLKRRGADRQAAKGRANEAKKRAESASEAAWAEWRRAADARAAMRDRRRRGRSR